MAHLPDDNLALLTALSFFIGHGKEKNGRICKLKGLEIVPRKYAYSGEYNCDSKSGQGSILYHDQSQYSGSWFNDKF